VSISPRLLRRHFFSSPPPPQPNLLILFLLRLFSSAFSATTPAGSGALFPKKETDIIYAQKTRRCGAPPTWTPACCFLPSRRLAARAVHAEMFLRHGGDDADAENSRRWKCAVLPYFFCGVTVLHVDSCWFALLCLLVCLFFSACD